MDLPRFLKMIPRPCIVYPPQRKRARRDAIPRPAHFFFSLSPRVPMNQLKGLQLPCDIAPYRTLRFASLSRLASRVRKKSKRTFIVFSSLVGGLTATSALLLYMAPAPLRPETPNSLSATTEISALDPIFQTARRATDSRWKYIYIHQSRTLNPRRSHHWPCRSLHHRQRRRLRRRRNPIFPALGQARTRRPPAGRE